MNTNVCPSKNVCVCVRVAGLWMVFHPGKVTKFYKRDKWEGTILFDLKEWRYFWGRNFEFKEKTEHLILDLDNFWSVSEPESIIFKTTRASHSLNAVFDISRIFQSENILVGAHFTQTTESIENSWNPSKWLKIAREPLFHPLFFTGHIPQLPMRLYQPNLNYKPCSRTFFFPSHSTVRFRPFFKRFASFQFRQAWKLLIN